MEPNTVKKESALTKDPSLVSLETRLQQEAEQEYGSLPWVRDKPADFKPQRVFLSYGYPELAICQHIYMALKARGHEPWFDKISLRVGRDWRGAIAEGVQNSQSVIACLSEHSTRDGEDGHSVCLDELAIAVGAKEGCIHTVLLGPESVVRPPDLVSHIQWLDMSDWEEKLNAGAEVFMPWFAACMSELFWLIESPESLELAGQIHALKAILQPACDSSQRRQAELLKNGVVGREWLTQRVNDWLDDKSGCPVCLLHGRPGVGKSVFSAFYTHYNHRVAAAIFCAGNQPNFNDPCRVLRTLAYLLACRLPDYRLALLRKLTADFGAIADLQGDDLQNAAKSARRQLATDSEAELFDVLFRNVLSQTIDGGRPNMAILIDGLDECSNQEGNALARVLSECFCYRRNGLWPRWLKVLVVARETQEVTQWLPDADAGGAVQWLPLSEAGEENLADIRAYFVQQLEDVFGQEPAWPRALEVLTERSGGYFLYAELMTKLLKQKGSLDDIDQYPEGLDNAFLHWFKQIFPDIGAYQDKFQDALGVLAAAPALLPETVLQDLFGWRGNDLARFIAPLEPLLRHGKNEFGDRTLALYHPYVGEWLMEIHKAERSDDRPYHQYYCSREDALRLLADYFCETVQDETQTPDDYVLLWLPVILQQSPETDPRGKRATHYKKLVQNGRYLSLLLDAGSRYGKQAALALPFYETAYAVAHDGAADGGFDAQLRLADCLHTLAIACLKLEDIATAFQRQNEYIDILHDLAAKPLDQETNAAVHYKLADAYDDLARMYMNQYRFGMAERAARRALVLSARLRHRDPDRALLSNALETLAFIRHWCNDSHREYVVHLREAALSLRYSAALFRQEKSAWLTFLMTLRDFEYRDDSLLRFLDDGDYAWSIWSLVYPDISAVKRTIGELQPDPAKTGLPAPARYKADLIEPRGRGTAITTDKLAVYLARRAVQERVLDRDDTPANRSALAATLQALADTACEQQSYADKESAEFRRRTRHLEPDSDDRMESETDEWRYLKDFDRIKVGEESVRSLYNRALELLSGLAPSVREADRALQEQFVTLCWTFAKKLRPADRQRTTLAKAGQEAAEKLFAQTQTHWHRSLLLWLTEIVQDDPSAAQTVAPSPVRAYLTTHLQPWFQDEDALSLLCEQCGDDLFRAVLMTDLLLRQDSMDGVSQRPVSLGDALRLWFATVFPDISLYRQQILPLLEFVLAAPAPTAAQELWQLVKARCADEPAAAGNFAAIMLHLAPLLKRSRVPGQALTLSFRDPRLAEWLSSAQAGAYRADLMQAKANVADFFYRRYRQGTAQMTEYEVLHLAAVLKNAADPGYYQALVQEDDWFERHLRMGIDRETTLPKDRDRRVQILQECRSIAEDAFSIEPWIGWRWAMARADLVTADTFKIDGPAGAEQAFSLYQRALETVGSTPGIMESGRVTVQDFIATACSSMADTLDRKDPKQAAKALALADRALAIWETLIEQDAAYERSWLSTCETVCRLLPREDPRCKQLSERGLELALKYYSESDRLGDILTIFIFEGFLSGSLSALQAAGGELYGELRALGLYKQSMTKWLAEYSKEKKGAWHWLFSCENVCRLLPVQDPLRNELCERALAAARDPDCNLPTEDRQGYIRAFEALSRGEGGPIWPVLV